MTNQERELDRVLASSTRSDDAEIEDLARTADDLTRSLAAAPPAATGERALFIEAVAARHRSMSSSLLVPGMAVVGFMLVIAIMGRGAVPGEALYPVRNVLRSAGLANAPVEVLETRLEAAETLVDRAEDALDRSAPEAAEDLAAAALQKLGEVGALIGELEADDRADFAEEIAELQEEALIVIRLASDQEAINDDSSGSGSGNSGSGSDDGSEDSSGSDSGSDDRSGSGSGDDTEGDSSGSGSGSDDNKGSDSSSDDSSGSGSGDDSDGDSSGPGSD
jgi:hypothetical protein